MAKIERICASYGAPLPTAAAIHFSLAGPAVGSLVLGAVSPEEVGRNVAALAAMVPVGLLGHLKPEGLLKARPPIRAPI